MFAFNYILYLRSNIETQFKSFGQDARKNLFVLILNIINICLKILQNNKRCEHLLKYSPKQEIILYRSISL